MGGNSTSALMVPFRLTVQPSVTRSPVLMDWMHHLPNECDSRQLATMAECGLRSVMGLHVEVSAFALARFKEAQSKGLIPSIQAPATLRIRTQLNQLHESSLIQLVEQVPSSMRSHVLLFLIETGLSRLLGLPFKGEDWTHLVQQRLSTAQPPIASVPVTQRVSPIPSAPSIAPVEAVDPAGGSDLGVFDMADLAGLIPEDLE